jgi:asparagine synthase (glutamine-hydrolysing)
MCGFVGIINKDKSKVDIRILTDMADRIAHRGPDGEGSYIEGHVGFYHKRLAIIDLATGHQPMISDNHAIVYNGEVYNYIELRDELRNKGHRFQTQSDTEVILKSYQEYSYESIYKFNGMFAFLLHDKNREQVIAARDHFGIKPLYYFVDKNTILFASEIKALLAHPHVTSDFDQDALNDYLTFQFVLGDKTLFKNIHKIMPGHYLVIDQNTFEARQVKYWSPNFSVDTFHTEAYFINELRSLINDSIRIQLRSDVPVGTYLSGGIDSSLITMIAARAISGRKISTFSGAFHEGPEFSEMEYVHEVVQCAETDAHSIYPTAQDFINTIAKLIYHLDEPVAGPGLFPQYMVSMLAKEKVKVILAGQGGDEIFGGYARYVVAYLEQAIKGAIMQSTEEGEHIVSLKTIIPNLVYIRNYLPMLKQFLSSGTFASMDARYFHLINRMEGNTALFNRDFLADYCKSEIFNRFKQLFNGPNTYSYYNKMTHFDLFGSLPALLQVEDRMSMAASIESRVPLLDRRIVDLIARMPPAMKFKGGEMKYILKKAIHNILPPKILHRTDKMGFPVPFHLWAGNEAKSFIQDTILCEKSRQRGIFQAEEMERISTSEKPYGRQLWGILSLELWFQQFIDQ